MPLASCGTLGHSRSVSLTARKDPPKHVDSSSEESSRPRFSALHRDSPPERRLYSHRAPASTKHGLQLHPLHRCYCNSVRNQGCVARHLKRSLHESVPMCLNNAEFLVLLWIVLCPEKLALVLSCVYCCMDENGSTSDSIVYRNHCHHMTHRHLRDEKNKHFSLQWTREQ